MTRVADILAVKGNTVFRIAPDAMVYEAIAAMVEHGVGSLLVAVDDEIHGIITERDYLAKVALEGKSSRTTAVVDIMSDNIVYAMPDQEVADVMAIMSKARIRHLPILADHKLQGLISMGDCVKQISQDRKAQIRHLTDYISDRYPG